MITFSILTMFVLILGVAASGPDVPHSVVPAPSFVDFASSSIDPDHRAQVIGAGRDHLVLSHQNLEVRR